MLGAVEDGPALGVRLGDARVRREDRVVEGERLEHVLLEVLVQRLPADLLPELPEARLSPATEGLPGGPAGASLQCQRAGSAGASWAPRR